MGAKLQVKVLRRGDRGRFVVRFRDPETGAWRERSEPTGSRKEAERLAGEIRAELRSGRYAEPTRLSWEDFRLRFEAEKLSSLSDRGREGYRTALNRLESLLRPVRLAELDAAAMSRFQSRLRDDGVREATIAAYLRHVKAALRWANDIGLLARVPKIVMPKRARSEMRGRPITTEEYERMLEACENVRENDYGIWRNLLQGLWFSGLRLGESLQLSWDRDSLFAVDLGGKFPCFNIAAEAEKGFKDRRLPMAPEFAEWLRSMPMDDREGKVFGVARSGFQIKTVSRVISSVGKAANVVVNKEQEKFGSAHDLRRGFGTRWSSRLMPADLQLLMRHESIETTLKYYVGREADGLAERIWNALEVESKR